MDSVIRCTTCRWRNSSAVLLLLIAASLVHVTYESIQSLPNCCIRDTIIQPFHHQILWHTGRRNEFPIHLRDHMGHRSQNPYFDFWLCACMSEGSPPWGAGNVRPKHQLVEQNFTKSSFTCIHNAGSCARISHWPNWWNRVCATSLLVQSCRGYPRGHPRYIKYRRKYKDNDHGHGSDTANLIMIMRFRAGLGNQKQKAALRCGATGIEMANPFRIKRSKS